ncbi:AAA family ATPase [Aureivirga marina]|uniref:AAA family ATPase n=1 Tax=Aureivirga marina TaxID=1182451 RepID=UPI0018C8EE2E|nr:ATP-binding protein [Aureivirga marina]
MEKDFRQERSNILKVVMFGPESTGKTTLSKQLAEKYKTVWVPEFARDFLQEKWEKENKICEVSDLIPIAKGQIKLENELAKQANKILFCDTNLLETKVYSEEYYDGYVHDDLEKAALESDYDFYFLTYIDTPWEEDDLRDRPHMRKEMFDAFKNTLDKYNKPYILLKGNKETRLNIAVEKIDDLLKNKK